jgi:hypothetical protein
MFNAALNLTLAGLRLVTSESHNRSIPRPSEPRRNTLGRLPHYPKGILSGGELLNPV